MLARLFASVHAQIRTCRRRKHLRVDEQRDRCDTITAVFSSGYYVVCFCTCTNTHVQKEEALACRRAARSMRHDHCCFSSGYYVHPRLVLLILIGVYEYRTITHLIRIRALLLHRSLGTQAKFVSHEGFFFLARAPDGGVRVGT